MNVVALDKIVAWLCDIYLSLLMCFGNYDMFLYLSLLICFGNYNMFLIIQMNLTCRSFQRTSNYSSKEEPEASRVKDTIAKERASEEYKESG